MTDRIKALTVVLDKDYREDDVEAIITSIKMTRGVLSVIPKIVIGIDEHVAYMRIKNKVVNKILDIFED